MIKAQNENYLDKDSKISAIKYVKPLHKKIEQKNRTITKDRKNLFYFPSVHVQRKSLIKNIEFVKNKVTDFIYKVTKTMN